jgi:hypothetical protein
MHIYVEIQKLAGWTKSPKKLVMDRILANIRASDYEEDLALFETRSDIDVRSLIEEK